MSSPATLSKRTLDSLDRSFGTLGQRVLRLGEIQRMVSALRAKREIAQAVSLTRVLRELESRTGMKRVRLDLPHRPETLYVWGEVSSFALGLAAKKDGYLCHYSAMAVHELTRQIPKTVYVNVEQRPHVANPASLTQASLTNAFRRPHRMTTNTAVFEGVRFVFLNGMNTRQLGVEELQSDGPVKLRVTDLPRTLIDIAVRPLYAGGVSEVLAAYRAAIKRVDTETIAGYLSQLDYVYPYHQAIGYYLERAGAKDADLAPFRRQPFSFDFYLAHGVREAELNSRWRLFVPKGL